MDWTAIISTVGTTFGVAAGVVGLWWMRILGKKQAHELAMKKLEIEKETIKEKRLLLEAQREDKLASQAKKDRKEEHKDLLELLEATRRQSAESREALHEVREEIANISNKEQACQIRLARMEALQTERESYERDLNDYIDHLTQMLIDRNIPVIRWVRRTPPGSGIHKALPASPDDYMGETHG